MGKDRGRVYFVSTGSREESSWVSVCQSEEDKERERSRGSKSRAVHVAIVIGMSSMTSQFGSGLFCSHSSLLPLSFSVCLSQSVPSSETFCTLSLPCPSCLPPSQRSFSLSSVLFCSTLPSSGPVENVIGGQESWWLSGVRHHE